MFRVHNLGLSVRGFKFRVWGKGFVFKVQGLGFRV
jgi:hypothetical protein